MAIGTTNAYATTQPIQGDPIGRAMNIVEQNAFRYREEEQEKADAAKKAEEARQKGIAELAGDYDYDISGFSSIDDPVYNFAMEAKKNVADLQQRMLQNPNMSQMEIADYKRQIAKQDQSFKYLKQFPTLLKAKVDGISKGIADGKYYKSDLERLQNEIKNLETGKFKLNIDKNGNPKITVYEQDENGAYTKVIKETGLGDYVNSLNPRKNFEYVKTIDDFSKNIKPRVTATQNGINITKKEQLTPQIINSVDLYAESLLSDKDYRSIILEENPSLDESQLRQKITDDIYARILTKNEQSLDSSMYGTNVRAAQDAQKTKVNFTKVDVPKSMRSAGITPSNGFTAVSVSSNVKPIDFAGGVTMPKISTYTITTDSFGKPGVYAEIVYPDVKTSTLSPEEQNVFAKLRNGEELTETEELTVSRVTKGAENKTKSIKLEDAEAAKFAMNMGLGSIEEMVELAKGDPNKKTDIEIWNEEFKKPRENKTPAKKTGTYDDI